MAKKERVRHERTPKKNAIEILRTKEDEEQSGLAHNF